MENLRKDILRRAYIIGFGMVLIVLAVIVRLLYVQNHDVSKYENMAQMNFRDVEIPAIRGDIYAADGVLLATTITKYDIHLDFKSMRKDVFSEGISGLSDSLSRMFAKPSADYKSEFKKLKQKENQYYKLATGLDYDQFERLKKFPVFEKGKNKGGFIVTKRTERIKPIDGFGFRTLGFDRGDVPGERAGLEGAFSEHLRGRNGKEIQQRINSNQWKPIVIEVEPEDGKDVYTTIDMRVQDIVYSVLQSKLEETEAEHGSVVVMEVKTGKIMAMANLQRKEDGTYQDLINFAVGSRSEVGSTFKAISMLALLDDGYVKPETSVDVGNGTWTTGGATVRDDHPGHGPITMSQVLSQSSNVGIAKKVNEFYRKDPNAFLKKIAGWGVMNKTGIGIPGEKTPYFPKVDNKWSSITLPWLSFGYGMQMTPLQVLVFYNAIANGGKMMKPQLLEKIMKDGETFEEFQPIVVMENMANPQVIKELQQMLAYAVENGTSRSIYTPNLSMAGKTGTTQLEYWKGGRGLKYQASFAGYFPVEDPEYSCIVVINKPKNGFYGAKVAAPVFKEIAGKIYLKKPQNLPKESEISNGSSIKTALTQSLVPNISSGTKIVPNVVGYYGKYAIPALENLGMKVVYEGTGKVYEQSISGIPLKKGMTVYLKLKI